MNTLYIIIPEINILFFSNSFLVKYLNNSVLLNSEALNLTALYLPMIRVPKRFSWFPILGTIFIDLFFSENLVKDPPSPHHYQKPFESLKSDKGLETYKWRVIKTEMLLHEYTNGFLKETRFSIRLSLFLLLLQFLITFGI